MMRRMLVPLVLFTIALPGIPVAGAGTQAQPEIVDPAGDANGVDGLAPGVVPGTPASVPWADITKAWFTADFTSVPARRDGERGMLKVPHALRMHIETAGAIAPTGPGIVYAAEWEVNNCVYRLLVHVPGAHYDSTKSLLGAQCGPSSYSLDLPAPTVVGNQISAGIPFATDADLHLYDGRSLARIRAFTAPYVDWYWDYRYTSDTIGYLDYAPSSGDLGYYEIGSDLAPRFQPGLAFEPGTMTTVAGGSHGDGLPATRASLANPWGVSVGPDGLVYVADYSHSRIRRIGADGTMEPFTGFAWGFAGDGGHRLRAQVRGPAGMDWGSDGTLYFADSLNHRVRAIAPDGTIRTVAGDGSRKLAGDGGPAKKAALAWPQDVAVDEDGDVFIADLENNRVRRVDAETGEISTYAGGGTLVDSDGGAATDAFLSPYGLAFDAEGDLWISDFDRIREVDAGTGAITTPVTGLAWARGIAFDAEGALYIADYNRYQVYRWTSAGGLEAVAGNGSLEGLGDGGPATDATLHHPMDVDLDDQGNLYIAERTPIGEWSKNPITHDRVRVVDTEGIIDTYAGTGNDKAQHAGGLPALGVDFDSVTGLAYDDQGRLYIAESATTGSAVPGSRQNGGLLWRLDPDGSIRVVAGNGQNGSDSTEDDDGPALETQFGQPRGIDVGPDGRVYYADVSNRKIRVYDPAAGTLSTVAGGSFGFLNGGPQPDVMDADEANLYFPRGLAVAPNGDVYWTEASYGGCNPSRVRRYRDGKVYLIGGTRDTNESYPCGYNGDGQPFSDQTKLAVPEALEFDTDGSLLIVDSRNGRIRRVDAETGVIETIVGDGAGEHRDGTIAALASLAHPIDVEPIGDGGYLVAENGLDGFGYRTIETGPRISHVAPNGVVSTVAGTGVFDLEPDDAPLASSLLGPNAIARSPMGHVAIADYHRVRILTPGDGGWPAPEREVVCLPNATDIPGDARNRQTLNMHTLNNRSLDLRQVDVATEDDKLAVTIRVEDLELLSATVPDDYHAQVSKGWFYMFWDGQTQNFRYLAAINPWNKDDNASAGGFGFEWGEITGGTFESLTFTRAGPATGSVDYDEDTITIEAPLATVGLTAGERVQYQVGVTGPLLQAPPTIKFSVYADFTAPHSWYRSFEVGRTCPEDY